MLDRNPERLQIIRRAKLNPDKVYSALHIAKALELGVAFTRSTSSAGSTPYASILGAQSSVSRRHFAIFMIEPSV